MNEQDKILLSAYLDSDLNDAETAHVEELLESSDQVKDYMLTLKKIKLENKNYFENSLRTTSFKQSLAFLNDLKNKSDSKFSLKELLFEKRLIFSNLGTVTAAMMLFLILQDPASDENNTLIFDLKSTTFSKEVFKTRGASSLVDDNKDLISLTILEMINERSSEGNLVYGSETFAIFLNNKISEQNNIICYSGNIFTKGESKELVFCKSPNDYSLIFTN